MTSETRKPRRSPRKAVEYDGDDFVHVTLERIRERFVQASGQHGPIATLLVRENPTTQPVTKLSPPKLIELPMNPDAEFPAFMGIVSSTIGSWRAASVFLTLPGWVVEKDGKKEYKGCACDGKHPEAKKAIFVFYEHETKPRHAWCAEVDGDPPESIVIREWQPAHFPPDMTIAFRRTN